MENPWGFVPTEELPCGYCSRVWADENRVLKVPLQGEELTTGLIAAVRMSGLGSPRVLEADEKTGTILMERARPGTPMLIPDAEALPIFADFFERHASLDTDGLLPIETYCGLHQSETNRVFLHGDLHHENILRHGDEWWAIDPKGLEGDPCFAASAVLRNPTKGCEDIETECLRRLEWFNRRFDWDPSRMMNWAVADAGDDESDERWGAIVRMLKSVQSKLA